MRITHRYLQWDSNLKIIKPVRATLDQYNISYKYKEDLDSIMPSAKYQIEFYLYEDNPNYTAIKAAIDKFEMQAQSGTVYEKADINAAQWFLASTGQHQYPQPEDGYLEKTFDLKNYCDLCGIGQIQNAPFRLKTAPKQINSQFWGIHWEYFALFVREETKQMLEREKINGIRFTQPVLNKNSAPIDGFYQLHVDNILPRGFDSYNTQKITCKINNEEDCNTDETLPCCGRIKFHHPRVGGYLFDKSIFNSGFDIVQTYEYFGSGGSANRLNIVSKRFKELVEKTKTRGIWFKPVVHNRLVR